MIVRHRNGDIYSGIVWIAFDPVVGHVIMVDSSGGVRATQWDAIAEIIENNKAKKS